MFDPDTWGDSLPPKHPWLSRLASLFFAVVVALLFFGHLIPISNHRRNHSPRVRCISNLRQVGLGIEGYANHYGSFPPGTVPNLDLPIDRRLGWGFAILPYIDMVGYFPERGTSQEIAAGLAWDDPIFKDLSEGQGRIASCPKSGSPAFVAIAGLGVDAPTLSKYDQRAGIFGDNRQTAPADIKDGTSHTMMVVEADLVPAPWFAGGRATVRGLDPARRPYIGAGRQFGGNHEGGVNVLFADGSARFISDSIDPKVFEALSTMAGGEAVPADLDE